VPVVLLHGWPSGPLEYLQSAELLAEAGYPALVPSLPGFGWSEDPGTPLNVAGVAERLHALLSDGLGVERYALAGGDWGAIIAARMAFDNPGAVAGLYLSTPSTVPVPGDLSDLGEAEREFVETGSRWRRRHGHHLVIQSAAPDVVSPALTDSPAGLAAYLVDKYRNWSDCGGEVEKRFSRDELCDFLTMFWATGTIASSMRLYWGERAGRWRLGAGETIGVPAAASVWPGEMVNPPREWSARVFTDLRRWTEMESGGHFAAFEEPELYTSDLVEFVSGLD
jgi:pimeloyl-ACP methyl ester carboxylesterase